MASKSLWGDLGKIDTIQTPKSILKEQARHLSEATNNVLRGVVREDSSSGLFYLYLDIVARALDDYKYQILELSYDIDLYPLTIRDSVRSREYRTADETEFTKALEEILSSPEVRKVISVLLSQAKA